ncbi:MAG: site-2 protease family protein [Bacteroidota bacterium]|nr:site-2 protease family protein [Bacteroidota bacterium]MDP4194544.1 site-2 protease family protein [Bacteroidota bacterium]
MPHISINERLLIFLMFLPVFFVSLAVHEYSHAFSAFKLGDNTAKNQGRLSLNPIRHLDLIGSILMPLLSFSSGFMIIGWAKPVQINRNNFKNSYRDDAIVSFAGPLSNFFLSVILFIVFYALNALIVDQSTAIQMLIRALSMGSYFNVFLFVFNLLPIPPLDGSHILFDLFPNRFTAMLAGSGLYGFFILMFFIYSPLWGYFEKIVRFIFELFIFAAGKL